MEFDGPLPEESATDDPLAAQVAEALGGEVEVIRRIGEGRAGAVYLGHQHPLDRSVAIKIALPRNLRERKTILRFQREARAMAGCPHPGIVPVHSVGLTQRGVPFFVMEFIEGETLAERLERRERLPLGEAVRIASALADALTYAHERGLVHRDVKPGNVLIEAGTGRVLIADFGLAKVSSGARGQTLTGKGEIVGEPAYMSPEQAERGTVDARSDQYSLAVVTYEMLAGRKPFPGPTVQEYVRQHALQTPPPISEVAPDVPDEVARVIERALMKEPGARFASAEAFGQALAAAARSVGRSADGAPLVDLGWLRDKRYLIQTAAIYAGLAWGVLESLSWVLETFGLPMELRRPALWLVVAGFPVALTVVWWLHRTSSTQSAR